MYTRLASKRQNRDLMAVPGVLDPTGKLDQLGAKAAANNAYWSLAYFLITHSQVLQAVHINKVCGYPKAWYKSMTMEELQGLINDVRRKFASGS